MAPACSTARPTSIANAVEVADKFKAVESLRANPLYSVAIWLAALDEVALLAVCLFIISFSIISDFIFHQGAWAPHIELINADDVARETLFGVKKLYSAHKSAFPSYNFPDAYWGVSNICKGIVEGRKTKSLPHTVRFYLLVIFLISVLFCSIQPRAPRAHRSKATPEIVETSPPSTGNASSATAMDVDVEPVISSFFKYS
jgi:hypothetical protein